MKLPWDVQVIFGFVAFLIAVSLLPVLWEIIGYAVSDFFEWWNERRSR